MLSKTKIALSAAFVLSTAFPALAATRHHRRVTHIRPAMIYNIYKKVPDGMDVVCPANGGPSCSSNCSGSGPCAPPDSW
jgi:hypothetical protein